MGVQIAIAREVTAIIQPGVLRANLLLNRRAGQPPTSADASLPLS